MTSTPVSANEPKTAIMIKPAAVMIPAVFSRPSATDSARAIWMKQRNPLRRHSRAGTTGADLGDNARNNAAESKTATSAVTQEDSGRGERNYTSGR